MTSTIRQDLDDDHYFDQHKVAVSDEEKENNARDFSNVVQHFH